MLLTIELIMNTQENNQLIAEFMGYKVVDKPKVVNGENFFEYIDEDGKYTYCNSLLRYNYQWDWLMPVANEIIKSRDEQNANWYLTDLKYSLQTTNINFVYKAVVEFIKQNNNQ